MTGQELVTAVQEALPVKVVLGDNGAYGTIAMHQHKRIGPDGLFAVHLRSPDFAAVARAYGAAAFVVERTAEFADAFAAALAHPGPALVHVKTDLRDISAAGPLPA
jgi:acetolactate synthase-1/2/3 large subunit